MVKHQLITWAVRLSMWLGASVMLSLLWNGTTGFTHWSVMSPLASASLLGLLVLALVAFVYLAALVRSLWEAFNVQEN